MHALDRRPAGGARGRSKDEHARTPAELLAIAHTRVPAGINTPRGQQKLDGRRRHDVIELEDIFDSPMTVD